MNKIALLTWWPGYERNIALSSARFFEQFLSCDYEKFLLPEEQDIFMQRAWEFDIVVPVLHGEYGEDGKIQKLLEEKNIPYIGSNSHTSELCMDKKRANIIARDNWLRVPQEICFQKWEKIWEADLYLDFPVMVKPKRGWSSYYTYKVWDFWELQQRLREIHENIDDDILLQEYILWDEYSVPVVDNEVLPIMKLEKNNSEDFFDYESKYESESWMREVFWQASFEIREKLTHATKLAQKIYDLRWYFRVDFIVRWEEVFFLEVNTIPGTTESSILPKAWRLTGRTNEQMLSAILMSMH